ncbi:general secretion pathway protein F [Desulfatibacillum alkenivorans DSM 16219]|jgi:general secretion pathway protein F|uniref:General secretion pathway protein F n=1 Tax=Desulfatibacillum alkenivorans DSM 16219 TaxID=1121393 RepID=A0A1M6BX34_9BACT|nr:type II secretion system inner membrane protein GspF [Desulfatibacillum alkenivorans]SHI53227.1 general secretion pathway protein F [Desulfatibacillum alkenivorans DSM 16219]
MPVYEYVALDSKGKKRTGILDADSPSVARAKLREAGSYPVEITEAPEASANQDEKRFSLPFLEGRIPSKYLSITTRQLSTLVGAGLPIVSALESLIPQSPHPALQKVLAHVKDDIVEGKSLADALSSHPKVFSPLYVNMVRAGEASGAMEIVLARLSDLTERNENTKGKIRAALAYPVIMVIVAIVVLTALMVKVVPSIVSLFDDVQQALPLPTRVLIAASDFLVDYWVVLFVLIFGAALAFRQFKNSKRGRKWWDAKYLRIPILGPLAQNLSLARFARTLASLLTNGVPLVPAMGIVQNVVENVHIAEGIGDAAGEIGEGRGLGESLAAKPGFPPITIQMMEVGEQSGELEAMLEKMADMYETETENTIDALTASLEPILIVAMAGGVGFIVFSILMPMMELTTTLR